MLQPPEEVQMHLSVLAVLVASVSPLHLRGILFEVNLFLRVQYELLLLSADAVDE